MYLNCKLYQPAISYHILNQIEHL